MSELDYKKIYDLRLNRYGLNYQSRIQTQREKQFEILLMKSVYRVDFDYNGEQPGLFERYKQDETETRAYLLTRVNLNLAPGTILYIPNKDMELHPWMVYWLENIKASGYNRYVMLKMTHTITWKHNENQFDEEVFSTLAYFYGQEDNMLKDEIRSRSRMDTVYAENLKLSFMVIPTNENIQKDDYFEIGEGKLKEAYRVTGYDRQSTPGVEYVSIDPIYIFDHTPAPKQTPQDNPDDFYWLNKGGDQ